ncbi:MAG: protein translocase subunit SecF [Bdellovibrionales bacterium]
MKKTNDFGRFDFVGNIGLFGGISLVLTFVSLVYLATTGINYGIDFRGGTEVQVKFSGPTISIDQVRASVEKLKLGDVGLQGFGDANEFVLRFQTPKLETEKAQNEAMQKQISDLKSTLETDFKEASPEFRRVDTVGPQVGAELKRNGFLAVFYCLLVILGYVAFRFDYQYAPGAVICLFHDAVITLAIFNLVGKEMNVPALAAIMTLIGFSLNDTIVVFDRIRETVSQYGDRGWKFVINKAINDMLVRTIITSGTVFTSAFCLFIFAEGSVKDIAFALTVGIIFGVYSSVYVAAPLILVFDKLRGSKLAKMQTT